MQKSKHYTALALAGGKRQGGLPGDRKKQGDDNEAAEGAVYQAVAF